MANTQERISANVRALMGYAAWSASELSRATGLARRTISDRMTSTSDWKSHDLDLVSDALNVTVVELVSNIPDYDTWQARRAPARATQVDAGLRYLVMPENTDDGLSYRPGALSPNRLTSMSLIGDYCTQEATTR